MILKVCGMREEENIRDATTLAIDMMGFIFYPRSARFVSELPGYLPPPELRTGIFVNEEAELIRKTATRFKLRTIQLHGDESPALCRSLRHRGYRVIKAFSIRSDADLIRVKEYEEACDYALFDYPCAERGGSGKKFDWQLLRRYEGKLPFLLSGGIGPDDIGALRGFVHPKLAGYDLNSCFEQRPGYKDIALLKSFIQQIRNQQL